MVAFLISRQSLASPVCAWEIEQAQALSKRIVPVLIDDAPGLEVPPALAALNYVRFDGDRSFMDGMEALRRAARVDLGWIREHTRLLARAQEWEAAGRNEVRLLAGDDVVSARAWLDRRPPNALAPTDLHRDFIAASAQAEAARYNADRLRAERLQKLVARTRRALFAAIGAALIAAAAGAIAYHQKLEADESRADAIDKQNQAITARETAEKAEKRALAAVMQAEVARLLQARLLQLAANRASPSAPFELDTLSQRYEGQSPDFIGVDLNGVAYYGTYRIKGGASMEEFLSARTLFRDLA